MAEVSLDIQDIIEQAVEDPYSALHGEAIRAVLSYGPGNLQAIDRAMRILARLHSLEAQRGKG